MKKILQAFITLSVLIIVILCSANAKAQSISVSDFYLAEDDLSAMTADTRKFDVNGFPCAIIKIETTEKNFSFDTGLLGVTDTEEKPGEIWVYVPGGVKRITISHKDFGVMRDYIFPVSIESSRTYIMTLKTEKVKVKEVVLTRYDTVKVVSSNLNMSDAKEYNTLKPLRFCKHFFELLAGYGGYKDDGGEYVHKGYYGVSYSYMGQRVGGYASFLSAGNNYNICGGPVLRLSKPGSTCDWQIYGGPGLIDGKKLGGDFGMKFGWESRHDMSFLDFSFGCQIWNNGIMPTVGIGLGISGITLVIGAGIGILALAFTL
jgi:hypothetical protein